MSGHIAGLITVLISELLRSHALRTENQYIITAELQQIRTLPHITEIAQTRLDLAPVMPAVSLRLVDQDRARLVLCPLGAEDDIAVPMPAEEIRITEMSRDACRTIRNDDLFFLYRAIRLQRAKTLGRNADIAVLTIAGIENPQLLN